MKTAALAAIALSAAEPPPPEVARGAFDPFRPDGTVTTGWSWCEKGKERWMEEIELSRVKP